MLEAQIRLLEVALNSLKQELTGCGIKTMPRKVANAKGDMNELASSLDRDTFSLHANIQHNVHHLLLALSNCLGERFDCEAKARQQGVHNALRDAVCGV